MALTFSLNTIKRRFLNLLGRIWFVPFGFYDGPLRAGPVLPHPLAPRDLRDLVLQKMMFPDNILRAVVADKLAVRGFVRERVGEKYLIPLVDICERPEDLRPETYPLPCVVKSSHASAQVHFLRSNEDIDGLVDKARRWLAKPYNPKLEWVYRDIKPVLLVEKMLADFEGAPPADIKIHCAFGEPLYLAAIPQVESADGKRFSNMKQYFFLDRDWNAVETDSPRCSKLPIPERPAELDEVLYLCRELTRDFDYIRLDVYIHEGRVYFGELTNFTDAANRTPYSHDVLYYQKYRDIRAKKIASERAHYSALGRVAGTTNTAFGENRAVGGKISGGGAEVPEGTI